MKNNIFSKFKICTASIALCAGLGLTGCYFDTQDLRLETAKRIASPSFLLQREIKAEPFMLTAYERVHDKGGDATIYIEGDGLAWLTKTRPSLNPTPRNPVALHLASHDPNRNIIYLARPCQYSGMLSGDACDRKYWTTHRFAPEVIDAMNMALDNMKRKYDIQHFNLVGFSGGGAVAALLTAKRDDVATLRTVAGNLDHVLLNNMHEVSQMPESLNAISVAADIAHIPQHHFIGEWDEVVTPAIYDNFRSAAGETTCMRSSIATKVNHESGWVNIWDQLLAAPLDCNKHHMTCPADIPEKCPISQ